ncbi:MAG: purine biosynthesis protein PurH [Lachnospiraceae bacterium]
MPGYLIKDTTMEERKKIVEESLGNIEASCDGCSQRVVDMYDAYIKGEKELRDINMEFNARYVRGDMEKDNRRSCLM